MKRTSIMALLLLLLPFLHLFSMLGLVFGQFPSSSSSSQWRSTVSAMFILGDSSVNCGDNTFLRSIFREQSYFSSFLGSDTRLLPDLLAEKMGLAKIPPFYGGNGTIEGLLSGLNFGSSKSTIINTGGMGFEALNQQLRQAFVALQMLQLQLGQENSRDLIGSSVFYMSMGKDDFFDFFFHDSFGARKKYGSGGFAHILVNQITQAIKDLYNANVRKIICMGIGPLGCAPRTRWKLAYNSTAQTKAFEDNCVEEFNEIILEYNTMLSEHLYNLNSELLDAQIVFCDVYQGMMEIITEPELYGFSIVNQACCGFGPYGGMTGCLSKAMSCEEPSTHVWWDLHNPTEAVNSLLADWTWSGQPFNICHQMSIGDVSSSNLQQ